MNLSPSHKLSQEKLEKERAVWVKDIRKLDMCVACKFSGYLLKEVLLQLMKTDCEVLPQFVPFTQEFKTDFLENKNLLN